MRKRIISSILLVIMLFGFGNVYAAQSDNSYEERYELLYALGILEEPKADKESFVTRGEFIGAAVRLRGITGAGEGTASYRDLNEKHKYYSDIMTASAFGLVTGSDDGNIMPDSVITSEQAGIILVRVLGYISLGGKDIPKLQELVASTGVLCGVRDMTWGNTVKIFVEMLDRNVVNPLYSGANAEYVKEGYTLLEKYHSIYEYDGIFEGAADVFLGGKSALADNEVLIGGTVFVSDLPDAEDFVGYRVKGYYRENSQTDENEIIAINKYKNDTLTILAEDIKSYTNGELEYRTGEKTKIAKTGVNLDVIYNGRGHTEFTAADILIENGSVTLIDNDGDGNYDVIGIDTYDIHVINGVDLHNGIIYLKYAASEYTVDLNSDNKTVEFLNDKGKAVDIRELMQNDVICTYESKDGEYVKAVLCTKEIEGTVESVSEDDRGMFVVIADEKFYVSRECITNQSVHLKVGTAAAFSLDVSGKICYIITATAGTQFAYVINTIYDDENNKVMLKLMLETGEIGLIDVRDRVTVDKQRYDDAATLYGALGGKSFNHRLIKCKRGQSGLITEISTTASSNNEDGLEMYHTDYDYSTGIPVEINDGIKHTFRSTSMTINRRVALSGNTVVMIVPNSPETIDEKYYKVDSSYLEDDGEYMVEAYRDSKEDYTADVLVIYDDVSSNYSIKSVDTGINVLDNLIETVTEDDEPAYIMNVIENGEKKQYYTKDKDIIDTVYQTYTPTRGDVIRYELKDGIVDRLSLIYSAEKSMMVAPVTETNEFNNNTANIRVWDAYVFYRWGSFMMLSETMPTDYENYNYSDYAIHPCATSNVVICKQGNPTEIYKGTADDIIGYKNTKGRECSKVVVYERWGEGRTIVIYK